MAPELFCPPTEYHKIDLRLADMWSVGATAFFLLTKQIFREEKDSSTNEFLETRGTRDFPSALKFVLTATIPDPSYRLGWKEASSHSWVASYKLAFSVLPSEEVEQEYVYSNTSCLMLANPHSVMMVLLLHRDRLGAQLTNHQTSGV